MQAGNTGSPKPVSSLLPIFDNVEKFGRKIVIGAKGVANKNLFSIHI